MPTYNRSCPICSKSFTTNRIAKQFCSPNCRWKDWDKKHPRVKAMENNQVMKELRKLMSDS